MVRARTMSFLCYVTRAAEVLGYHGPRLPKSKFPHQCAANLQSSSQAVSYTSGDEDRSVLEVVRVYCQHAGAGGIHVDTEPPTQSPWVALSLPMSSQDENLATDCYRWAFRRADRRPRKRSASVASDVPLREGLWRTDLARNQALVGESDHPT
jgi:hypothetical protein